MIYVKFIPIFAENIKTIPYYCQDLMCIRSPVNHKETQKHALIVWDDLGFTAMKEIFQYTNSMELRMVPE